MGEAGAVPGTEHPERLRNNQRRQRRSHVFFRQRLKKKQGIPILVVLGLFGEMTARDQE
jgi:hypothetical protein